MTVKQHITLSFLFISLIVCRAQYESKSSSMKPIQRLTKLFKSNDTEGEDYSFHHNKCGHLPPTLLTDVLGAAFNSRYMSIEEPKYLEDHMDNHHRNSYSTKRDSVFDQSFYVDDTYALEISDKPAWEVKHAMEVHDRNGRSIDSNELEVGLNRLKRHARRGTVNNMQTERPWECNAKIKWIDLGPEYFPRFLRSVECTKKKCWYNHYVCKPRSFTVKLLRRRNGECVQSNQLSRITNKDLPGDLKELWVWEERAVNFCCDCAFP